MAKTGKEGLARRKEGLFFGNMDLNQPINQFNLSPICLLLREGKQSERNYADLNCRFSNLQLMIYGKLLSNIYEHFIYFLKLILKFENS